jgi:cell division protein FtsA
VGGDHFTNDIAVGLRMPIPDAEKLKRRSGCALTAMVPEHDTMEVASIAGRRARTMARRVLSEILQPRAEEICHLLWDEIRRAAIEKSLNSGIVITGGASCWRAWRRSRSRFSTCRCGARPLKASADSLIT